MAALTEAQKGALFALWRSRLLAARTSLHAEQGAAKGGTRVDGSFRPENRGERAAVTAQGYLAAGLAQRLAELDDAVALLDRMRPDERARVSVGAAVLLDAGEEPTWVALLPGGDATVVVVGQERVTVLSAEAPLARALLGLEAGDAALHPTTGVELELVEVC